MKRSTRKATLSAYLGAVLLVVGFYPGLDSILDRIPMLHALWHLWLFIGAALLIYGLESLRILARRYHRMTT
ncbi:hypothetical protein JI721_03350 [Alicyclobacillus cycloheptanicus]|uniref:Membrane channel-forming protein YqfA (Hemolysin III family) n=1 Tax=Alicyclobacillus cycloheptanicus TaxID=1457 RepID=A0ABT9XME9_9BACL|nr:hypothetical protein [Alicyclobacillus cycloheptanicus]MDQ0191487.1 putative membrane channel-forming protein YqfA (hemolysin III family) [Alicyclobacillus cycloheptanicus]WDM01894.1 hypothetical protein JI721_03350 [Alicyclobacillus cycloheptanicus]